MTLEQLRIFAAVADRLHMTRAAQALNITQSTASAAVATLEARYGVLLFNRVGRGLELSEAGRIFLAEAKEVLTLAEAAANALDELSGLKRGRIRIAASQTVASYWLPGRMAVFAAAHPAIEVGLTVANTQQVAEAVLDGAGDVGFVEGEVEDELLNQIAVGGDRLSLYAAPDHPLHAAGKITVEHLMEAVWIMREPGSGTRASLESEFTAIGMDLESVKVLLELPSNEAVLAAAASGGALAAVSDLAAAPHIVAGSLRRLTFALADRRFTRLLHRDRTPSRAVAAFLAQL
jgi:DNA-binding transcriptional LysR family regulator